MSLEEKVKALLDKEKGLSHADALVIFDRHGFLRIESTDISPERVKRLIDMFCPTVGDLKNIQSIDREAKPEFLLADFGKFYVYLASVSENVCLMGVFSKKVGPLKILQGMGVVSERIKEFSQELETLSEKRKEEFLKEKGSKVQTEGLKTKTPYLTTLQVEGIFEEFKNELGPASEIVFHSIADELGFDLRHLTKDQAYEFINRLSEEIENPSRRERFVKVALSILES